MLTTGYIVAVVIATLFWLFLIIIMVASSSKPSDGHESNFAKEQRGALLCVSFAGFVLMTIVLAIAVWNPVTVESEKEADRLSCIDYTTTHTSKSVEQAKKDCEDLSNIN